MAAPEDCGMETNLRIHRSELPADRCDRSGIFFSWLLILRRGISNDILSPDKGCQFFVFHSLFPVLFLTIFSAGEDTLFFCASVFSSPCQEISSIVVEFGICFWVRWCCASPLSARSPTLMRRPRGTQNPRRRDR
jgi:hypothetical protein